MAVLAAPGLLGLWVLTSFVAVPHAAVHLCKWPATISCREGVTWMWVGLSAVVGLITVAGTIDVLAIRPRTRLGTVRGLGYAAWVLATVLTFMGTVQDRELSAADLAIGTVLVVAGLVLVIWTIRDAPRLGRRSKQTMSGLVVVGMVVTIFVVATAPARFQQAWEDRFAAGQENA